MMSQSTKLQSFNMFIDAESEKLQQVAAEIHEESFEKKMQQISRILTNLHKSLYFAEFLRFQSDISSHIFT